jgi:hypothetical protein
LQRFWQPKSTSFLEAPGQNNQNRSVFGAGILITIALAAKHHHSMQSAQAVKRTGCKGHWLQSALAAKGTGCKAHWLQSALAAKRTRCKAHSLQSALAAKRTRCKAHSLQSALAAKYPRCKADLKYILFFFRWN